MIPEAIQKCADMLKYLPGIGPRNATRLAFKLAEQDPKKLQELISALENLHSVERCEKCFFIKEKEKTHCGICEDKKRKNIVAIVEKDTDIVTLERIREFSGTYLVLGELSRGMLEEEHKERIGHLKKRIKDGEDIEEIVVGVGPHALGDMIFEIIKQNFKDSVATITRLARGIPTGGEIEFADEETLRSAIKRRSDL